MNFWKYDVLARRLKNGKVESKERFFYFFIVICLFYCMSFGIEAINISLTHAFLLKESLEPSVMTSVAFLINLIGFVGSGFIAPQLPAEIEAGEMAARFMQLIVFIVGFAICFKANREGDDKEFIERTVCLSLPIKIRIAAISAVLMLIMVFVALGVSKYANAYLLQVSTITTYFVQLFLISYYFYALNNGIKIAATNGVAPVVKQVKTERVNRAINAKTIKPKRGRKPGSVVLTARAKRPVIASLKNATPLLALPKKRGRKPKATLASNSKMALTKKENKVSKGPAKSAKVAKTLKEWRRK